MVWKILTRWLQEEDREGGNRKIKGWVGGDEKTRNPRLLPVVESFVQREAWRRERGTQCMGYLKVATSMISTWSETGS